jgi:hypothetical protein
VGDRGRAVIDSIYASSLSQRWISKWITSAPRVPGPPGATLRAYPMSFGRADSIASSASRMASTEFAYENRR